MTESKVDVLIIGAGPAGLMCANALAHAKIPVRIIDKRPGDILAGQADGIHARTLEILQSYGLARRLIDESAEIHRAAFYVPGPTGGIERLRRLPAITAPTTARFPFTVTLHQGAIEAIFHDDMRPQGLDIDRPTIPTSIELSEDEAELKDPQAYPVKVVVQHLDRDTDNTEVIRAKFVLGADGAHSWVRKAMDINMEGDMSDFIWGVIDIDPDTDYPDVRNLGVIHSMSGSALMIPREGNLLRLYVQLSDADVLDPETGRLDKARTSPEKVLEMAQKILHPYQMKPIGDIRWWTLYVVGQRVANKYSVRDRIFISGDACHTHSPKAGQGMNASMSDTHNLAWKLAYVLRGWADISLLQTYEFERRKFAVDLINFDRQWASLFSSGKARLNGNDDSLHDMFRKNGQFTSGIGIRYESSTIVQSQYQSCATNLIVGERMMPHVFIRASNAGAVNLHDVLPADTRFKILVFVGNIQDETVAKDIQRLGEELDSPKSFLHRYGHGGSDKVFDVLCISASSKQFVDWSDFPKVLRPHWSKVFLDDDDMHGRVGGGGFATFGINPTSGAIVVVRPDGHVGLVAPTTRPEVVDAYFGSFMTPVAA
ncbi:FAD binding domain-containing protein [Lenzites betulinus]|nr:FAD binding domain-containing protein [Lenzites betulinus]